MLWYLLGAVSVCVLSPGAVAEDCVNAVLNRRESFNVLSGERLSLSCLVRHCGEKYTCEWMWKNYTDDTSVSVSKTDHRSLSTKELSETETRHILGLERVSELDEGYFGCRVKWSSAVDQGHFMYVNVTAAASTDRKPLHRILICLGVALCLAVVLGLLFCLRSKATPQSFHRKVTAVSPPRPTPLPSAEYQAPLDQSTPQPLPRRNPPEKNSAPSRKTPHRPEVKSEVVYADISQDALRQQQQRVRQSEQQSTVYSSLRFT